MARGKPPQSERLRRGLGDRSVRGLARALADRDDVEADFESVRKTLQRALVGKQPLGKYEPLVEEELGLPTGYLFDPDPTATRLREIERHLDQVADEVRRLRELLEGPRESRPVSSRSG